MDLKLVKKEHRMRNKSQIYTDDSYKVFKCFKQKHIHTSLLVGFEVLTTVLMKSTIFWDIMLCSPLKVNQHFRGTYHLHLQGRRISQARNQHESRWQAGLSSETSVDFRWTTWCYIPEDITLHTSALSTSAIYANL
jgi:hypothetical protein